MVKLKLESNGFDSFFVYKTKTKTYVNLNDYQVTDEKDLQKLQLKKVDYLLFNFLMQIGQVIKVIQICQRKHRVSYMIDYQLNLKY